MPVKTEWWQTIFTKVIGEVMFGPRESMSGKEVQIVIQKSRLKRGSAVLDLACGTGRHSVLFAKQKFKVTGLDYSKIYLKAARKRAKNQEQKVNFIFGDMKDLKNVFENEKFDLVVSLFNSFGYFKTRNQDLKMLREIYCVLKPGGCFVINTLNRSSVVKVLGKPVSRGYEPIENVFCD